MADQWWMAAWFARISKRSARQAATTEKPQAQQQPEDAQQFDREDNYNSYQAKVEDGSEEDGSKEGASEPIDEATPADPALSAAAGSNNIVNNFLVTACRAIVNKVTMLVAQAKNAMINAVERIQELGFAGAAKAVGEWIKLHSCETAAIVALIAIGCTGIGLSAVGFGGGGIAAGMRHYSKS